MQNKILAASSLLLAVASAQTTSKCNPTDTTTCKPDPGLGSKPYDVSSINSLPSQFTLQSESVTYSDGAADFTISKEGDAPTIVSNFYFFFGTVEVHMKTAPGTGIVSSIVCLSDDLDEIDWEFLGSVPDVVQTNYFGKANTETAGREQNVTIANSQSDFHNYTLNWSSEQIEWIVDGQTQRTLTYEEAAGGSQYPQTPMQLKIGTWAGGDPKNPNGTIAWAGGDTNYNQGPFTASVQSIRVVDASQGTSYTYGDQSGSYQSIKISKDGSSSSDTNSTSTSSGSSSEGSGSATQSAGASGVLPTNLVGGLANSTSNSTSSGTSAGSSTSAGAPAATTSSAASAGNVIARGGLAGLAGAVVAFGMALM